ncbi:sugar transferase [Actinomyces polynesiensis]|uniref:sugar transferase n=1 Tax=Actinomyces polynesiensis TaxID=1325934 RepID=UPI0006945ECB|nr:sugar transferase [Actinomyces polynesiensis]
MSSILRVPRASTLPAALQHLLRPTAPRFTLLVSLTDLAAILLAIGAGHLVPVGAVGFDGTRSIDLVPPPGEGLMSVGLVGAWLLCLLAFGTYGSTALGPLRLQVSRATCATGLFVGTLAFVTLLLHISLDRSVFLLVPPIGLALILLGRLVCHAVLLNARASGHLARRALVLGGGTQSTLLSEQVRRHPDLGVVLVGSLETDAVQDDGQAVPGTDPAAVIRAMEDLRADTLVVSMTTPGLDAETLRAIRWELDAHGKRLALAPPLTGVSGERMVLSRSNEMALLQVAGPTFTGMKYLLKRGLDLVAASAGILLLTPVWLLIAAVVKFGDGGAVIFRQNRVGLDGREFPMFKFRTMVPDAEAVLTALQAAERADAGNTVMFKMRQDPRVTRVGRLLRRFSLDELPQLFNVWLGHMSLVGPRPPLPREVAEYEEMVNRKFLIRPGITGLWQTSGRSNLSWEESVRLDLFYVENWTLRRDVLILLRTARAVVSRDGAF